VWNIEIERVSPFATTLWRLVVESVNAIAAVPIAKSERPTFRSRNAAEEAFFGKYEPVTGCFQPPPLGAISRIHAVLPGPVNELLTESAPDEILPKA